MARYPALATCALVFLAGCFTERPFPMQPGDVLLIRPGPNASASPRPVSAREWIRRAEPHLHRVMPNRAKRVMTTDQVVDASGRPRDVYAWFGRRVEQMQGLLTNFWALQHTAQSIERGEYIETPAELWPGFEDVWIPVAPALELHGFLGFARNPDGAIRDADCIVLIPGLWGDNGAKRSRDLSIALQSSGFHVLSLEQRGCGQTEARYPDTYFNYGVIETQDLMKVSEWLQDEYPNVRRTGLIGFCWGANQALLAAWYDGRSPDDPAITPRLRQYLAPLSPRRHYTAGILAFSPVLRWEHFLDRMEIPKNMWLDTSPSLFQESAAAHMRRKGFPEVAGSLRRCIAWDFAWSMFGPSFPVLDGYCLLRLLPYRNASDGSKLERARVPVLIVHAQNDPLQTAQEVVDLAVQVRNPDIAVLILPGGGHIGFQAWSRRYFYSLIVNYFDPVRGAAAGR